MNPPACDDPIVAFRKRKSQVALIHRRLALNAEGIRLCRLYEKGIEACLSVSDTIQLSLLCSLYNLQMNSNEKTKGKNKKQRTKEGARGLNALSFADIHDELNSSSDDSSGLGFWSLNDLSWDNMIRLMGASSDDEDLEISVDMSDIMSDMEKETDLDRLGFEWDGVEFFDDESDDESEDCRPNLVTKYEEILMTHSFLLGCTLQDVNELCHRLVDLTAIRQSEWEEMTMMAKIPKQNRLIDDHTDVDLINLTRFNKQQLHTIKSKFFDDEPGDSYSTSSHKFTYEETLLIALNYMAKAENYSTMYKHFGGDWQAYTYPINWFTNFVFVKYYHRITGSSMEYWASSVPDFRRLIWSKACVLEDGTCTMPLEEFYNFGFIDCISHETFLIIEKIVFKTNSPVLFGVSSHIRRAPMGKTLVDL